MKYGINVLFFILNKIFIFLILYIYLTLQKTMGLEPLPNI
ncbi:hypothetical protein VT72_17835 [Clostridium botulinum]|uniref:Uncharacterized protein n=1 Tax=Clostridium botulinum (strain Langeland / NCTC 10281 / Type F) TaxID=441772 RepID=A7GBC9_CLOBL|nr:hypothetical protein CLI_0817 [Clostridium botulinum F str. Langeland]ADF98559.1 hypothetical protein CBF_0788 [Clostridium botulinum F str. 230613]KKM40156.1 hypothetical protein VT72_17835 [Clostridium botulinum]